MSILHSKTHVYVYIYAYIYIPHAYTLHEPRPRVAVLGPELPDQAWDVAAAEAIATGWLMDCLFSRSHSPRLADGSLAG